MRLKQYINEGKKLQNPMIGFGFKYSDIKTIVDYVSSELINNNIKYTLPDDYHLSLAMISGKYSKDKIVRTTNTIKLDYKLIPVNIKLLRGKVSPKDFITIEYKPNDRFLRQFKNVSAEYKTIQFSKIIPHISLFMVSHNAVSNDLIQKIIKEAPKIKPVKPTEIQIWNNKHQKEYIK